MAPQVVVVALLFALSTACGASRVVRLDTGPGTPQEYRPPTSSKPVKVEGAAFERALAGLVLDARLTRSPPGQGWPVPVSYPSLSADDQWRHLMARGYGGLCKP